MTAPTVAPLALLGFCPACGEMAPCPAHPTKPEPDPGPEPLAHAMGMVHSRPIQGCPFCPQPAACAGCGLGQDQHTAENWIEHDAQLRASETEWRRGAVSGVLSYSADGWAMGVGQYGRKPVTS